MELTQNVDLRVDNPPATCVLTTVSQQIDLELQRHQQRRLEGRPVAWDGASLRRLKTLDIAAIILSPMTLVALTSNHRLVLIRAYSYSCLKAARSRWNSSTRLADLADEVSFVSDGMRRDETPVARFIRAAKWDMRRGEQGTVILNVSS